MSRGSTSPSGHAEPVTERDAPPVIVYIAGSGRSGSTLLERVIGAIPGQVNVGELIDLPRRVAVDDEICGCGEPFSRCPFWTAVGQRAYGGWDSATLERLHSAQHQGRAAALPATTAPRSPLLVLRPTDQRLRRAVPAPASAVAAEAQARSSWTPASGRSSPGRSTAAAWTFASCTSCGMCAVWLTP